VNARERLARLRATKSWVARLALARDRVPGTEFDDYIIRLKGAYDYRNEADGAFPLSTMCRDWLLAFGTDMARAVVERDSDYFRRWASAIDAWNEHEPGADKLREALILCCVPPKGPHTMREVLTRIAAYGVKVGLETPRQIRRLAPELGITIKGERGRPPVNRTRTRRK
jgi:hypothetical protein